MTDPSAVPLSPVYIVIVSAAGDATVDGTPVEPLPGQDGRTAALAEIRVRAARRGRPVRVTAKEPDGAVWPLIVDADGQVTTLDQPHPQPQPPAPAVSVPPPPTTPAPTVPVPPPAVPVPAPVEPELPPPDPSTLVAAMPPAAGPVGPDPWTAPLPEHLCALLGKITAADRADNLIPACAFAEDLEAALHDEYGAEHPYTINALGLRAYLALREGEDWLEATELNLQVAAKRHQAEAPRPDTVRHAHNAHAAWRRLTEQDPRAAVTIGPDLLRVLQLVGAAQPLISATMDELAALNRAAS